MLGNVGYVDVRGYYREIRRRRTEHFRVWWTMACACGEMYLLNLLPAWLVGLAMVAACTCRVDCSPWAHRVEVVAVSLNEGYETIFVDSEHRFCQGWPTLARRRATWFIRTCPRAVTVYTCIKNRATVLTKKSVGWQPAGPYALRKSSGTSGARLFRWRRDWDGLRSPFSSCVRSWRTHWSRDDDRRRTSSVLRVV